MEIIVKKTTEMVLDEKLQICGLFKEVFGIEKIYEDFIHQFEENELSYSYFGLMYDGGRIVGSYAVIPFSYKYYEKEVFFGQSVDTMIKKSYRGNPFTLKKMANIVYEELIKDKIPFVYGFPNEEIYLVRKRVLRWKDIYDLDMYVLPLRASSIHRYLGLFNIFNNTIINIINYLTVLCNNKIINEHNIRKTITSIYEEYKYSEDYIQIKISDDAYLSYVIRKFKELNLAFIVDIQPLNEYYLGQAVKKISADVTNVDAIVYMGYLEKKSINIFKVPDNIKPKNVHFCGKVLISEVVGNEVFDIKNWKVNISNFDWI